MAVTTKLTWSKEKSLQKLLGNASLSLLYKSSVHGFKFEDLLQRCSHQGPTVTIFYSKPNIFGIFMLEHYPKLNEDFGKPTLSFCFLFPKTNNTEMPTFFFDSLSGITDGELKFFSCGKESFCLLPSSRELYIGHSACEQFEVTGWHKYFESEVFRVEGIKDDPGNIRKINGVTQRRENLLTEIKTYKPIANLVPEINILLVGPIGSGKSSFFNSVKSVFQGRVTQQAIAGSEITGITEQYRIYSIKDGEDGKYLPFTLCDSMGLGEKEGVGLCMDDIPHILKGCVPDRYQFNPHRPITPHHPAFITSPLLKDRIHCVVYVLDVNSINDMSSTMVSKLKRIQKEVLNYGVAHMALLTKVNNYDDILQDNFLNMNRSMTYQSQIMSVNKMLGIPLPNILRVGSYASEWELDPLKDVLILSAVRQMLRAADDILEDSPLEKTDESARMFKVCM